MKNFVGLVVLLIIAGGLFSAGYFLAVYTFPKPEPVIKYETLTVPAKEIDLDSNTLMGLVNKWREEHGLKTLQKDDYLCKLAEKRAQWIIGDWSHDGFIMLTNYMYDNGNFNIYGENLARLWSTEQETLDKWINSPEHFENINSTKYSKTCVACVHNYCAQMFGGY